MNCMRLFVVVLAFGSPSSGTAQSARADTSPAANAPLVGDWQLNLGRTRYGPGVDRRQRERFTCTAHARAVQCTIRSVRAGGQVIVGRFTATLDGSGSPVTGVPDVDEVRLRPVHDGVVDAVFSHRGAAAFGYRAYRAADGRSLMFVSVNPVSGTALNTIVVYDRR